MASEINKEDVRRKVESGALLLDVMPADRYEALHIAGAASLPLGEMDRSRLAALNRSRPVIVYCASYT